MLSTQIHCPVKILPRNPLYTELVMGDYGDLVGGYSTLTSYLSMLCYTEEVALYHIALYILATDMRKCADTWTLTAEILQK